MVRIVQSAVLLAGILILVASVVFAIVGSLKKLRTTQVIDKTYASFGVMTYNVPEVRIPFVVRETSYGILDVKRNTGRFEISLKRAPFPPPPEANVMWVLPPLYTEMSNGNNRSEHTFEPGTYMLVLTNAHGGDSSTEVNLTHKEEAFPKLYDVGIQMLIVAVPLIVAGILS